MKTVADIIKEMITFFDGNRHEVNHMLKVWSYARTIGNLEALDDMTQQTLEIAAIVHDIACPLCREKYGSVRGELQEKEGFELAKAFLSENGFSAQIIDRIAYLVGHHHTLTEIRGLDYQILIEADYIVNADESEYSIEEIKAFKEAYFKTPSGIEIIEKNFNL